MPFQVDVLRQCKDCIEDTWETVATKEDLSEARDEAAGVISDDLGAQVTLWEVDAEGTTLRQIDTI
jgi:hypothetical protein